MKNIKCKKCNKQNILDAKYYICCDNKFTEKEIHKARQLTFVGILETNININGNNLKLAKNENYSIKHYKDMYYVIVDKDRGIIRFIYT